jgi:hypothetical protein
MLPRRLLSHIGAVFSWNTDTELEVGEGAIAGLGFLGPILLGVACGDLAAGLAASTGSLPVGGVGTGRNLVDQLRSATLILLPTAAAAAIAELLMMAGDGGRPLLVGLAVAAAVVGGYSPTAAALTTRFTLFLVITLSLAQAAARPGPLIVLLIGGALWTALLWLLYGAVARRLRARPHVRPQGAAGDASATAAPYGARWKASLRHLRGWLFALKLGACLAIAQSLDLLFPRHHLHWIALTVVILAQRRADLLPVRTTQRTVGAILGAVLASFSLTASLPIGLMIAAVGLIASTRPLLKARHYLSYSAMMTTLIVLLTDFGQPVDAAFLLDRVIATLIGAALVITAHALANRLLTAT